MSTGPALDLPPPVHDGARVKLDAIVALKGIDTVIVWIGGKEVTLTNFEFNVSTGGMKNG